MTSEYAVKALKVLFGGDNVTSDKGEIGVRVRYPGHNISSVRLTIEQAKFVVARSICWAPRTDIRSPNTFSAAPMMCCR